MTLSSLSLHLYSIIRTQSIFNYENVELLRVI